MTPTCMSFGNSAGTYPTRNDASSAPVAEGDILAGKYKVERVLGAGGMGVVVAARHLQLDQLVALKFVLQSGADDRTMTERFLREAKAAVRLKSEHVAKVLDVGTLETGAPYIVMEYLEGTNLAEVIAHDVPIAAEVACDYLIQACEALSEAHTLGIVHRDLKPQNLFLTKGVGGAPLVKVLDFGISKIQQPEGAHNLTQTSTVIGSPLYMAPEQMRSARNADSRSDIWALGVVLYELLTRALPFEAETITDLAIKIVQDPFPALDTLRPDLPVDLATVVSRCLEKDPASRFADAGELASALEPFASAASRVLADRARKVVSAHSKTLGASVGPLLAAAARVEASGPVRAVSSPTHKSPTAPEVWSDTNGKVAQKAPTWLVALAAATAALVVAFIAFRVFNHAPETVIAPVAVGAAPSLLPTPPASPVQSAPPAPAPVTPAAQASASTATPAGSAIASTVAFPVISPAPSVAPSLRPAPSARAPSPTSAPGARTAPPGATAKSASSPAAANPSNDDIPSLR